MSGETHYKAACNHCGGHVEFPAESEGATVDCPHCKGSLLLHRMQQEKPSPPQNLIKKGGWWTRIKKWWARLTGWWADAMAGYPAFEKPKPKIQPAKPVQHLKPKKEMTPEEFCGSGVFIGVLLFLAGVGLALYYFQFYPLSNSDADVVNEARLHYSLCGVIIGVGLGIVGTIVTGIFLALGIWAVARMPVNPVENLQPRKQQPNT